MKKFYFIALVFMLAFAPLSKVHAKGGNDGWMLGFDINQQTAKSETASGGTTASSDEVSITSYDVGLGYVMGSGLYVGGLYNGATSKVGDTSTTANGMGASLGYVFGPGLHFTGSYILSATNGEMKKGSGLQMDFGWRTFVSGSFFLGAKLSYKSLKYTEVSGVDSVTVTGTQPYVSFGFSF